MSSPIAIVTGAGSGIGLALTKHLLSRSPPYRVMMVDLPTSSVASHSTSLGSLTTYRHADVSIFAEQAQVFKEAFAWGSGRIDFLAANAGIADKVLLHEDVPWDMTTEIPELDLRTLQVDLHAVIQGIWLFKHYAALSHATLGSSYTPRITITASPAGIYCPPTLPLYVAAKAALIGLTYSVGPTFANLGRKGGPILINAVLPGFVETGLAPPELISISPPEHITPMSTVMDAFEEFLRDERGGRVLECSLGETYERIRGGDSGYVDESARWLGEESSGFFAKAYEKMLQEQGREN